MCASSPAHDSPAHIAYVTSSPVSETVSRALNIRSFAPPDTHRYGTYIAYKLMTITDSATALHNRACAHQTHSQLLQVFAWRSHHEDHRRDDSLLGVEIPTLTSDIAFSRQSEALHRFADIAGKLAGI
jgi:hypothetical protein